MVEPNSRVAEPVVGSLRSIAEMREPETIKIAHEGAYLLLSDVHDGWTTRSRKGELYSFHARLALPGLRADAQVHLGPPVERPLPDYFEELAEHWRGWEGQKEWEAYEGGLALRCTHDGLGNIAMTVELREYYGDLHHFSWVVRGDVPLDAGQVDGVAADLRRFMRVD